MNDQPKSTSITFDANVLMRAFTAANVDIPAGILQEVLRGMILGGQSEISRLSTENYPLKARIRMPVSGNLQGHAENSTSARLTKKPDAQVLTGHIGHHNDTHNLLGPKAAAKTIGVSRSTLDNWRRSGLIIALPKGKSSHVIPLVQFVQGRPLPGIKDLLLACEHDALRAWAALTSPLPNSEETVLDAALAADAAAMPALIRQIDTAITI
jgi:hypothetical protein